MQLHPYYIQFTALAAALTTLGQRIHDELGDDILSRVDLDPTPPVALTDDVDTVDWLPEGISRPNSDGAVMVRTIEEGLRPWCKARFPQVRLPQWYIWIGVLSIPEAAKGLTDDQVTQIKINAHNARLLEGMLARARMVPAGRYRRMLRSPAFEQLPDSDPRKFTWKRFGEAIPNTLVASEDIDGLFSARRFETPTDLRDGAVEWIERELKRLGLSVPSVIFPDVMG